LIEPVLRTTLGAGRALCGPALSYSEFSAMLEENGTEDQAPASNLATAYGGTFPGIECRAGFATKIPELNLLLQQPRSHSPRRFRKMMYFLWPDSFCNSTSKINALQNKTLHTTPE
jgi:hypothetical protein